MHVHLASYYALHVASAVAAAPVAAVASPPAPMYAWELAKVVIPALITGLVVLRGFKVTFERNIELKKREILYKEQLDSVKTILTEYQELVEIIKKELTLGNAYDDLDKILEDYLNGFKYNFSLQLPLLRPMSRYAVGIFDRRIRHLRSIRIKAQLEGHKISILNDDETSESYRKEVFGIINYLDVFTDVLYRDLDMPEWTSRTPKALAEFDNKYKTRPIVEEFLK